MGKKGTFVGSFILCMILLIIVKQPIQQNQPFSNGPNNNQKEIIPAVPKKPFMAIRVLILKHSQEKMADYDANLAVESVQKASGEGLSIKMVDNKFSTSIGNFKEMIDSSVSKGSQPGDTLVVHTIGHGFPSGGLDNLGKRTEVVKILGEAAQKNKQKILWWQLSCFACAGLPTIDSLPPEQQQFLSFYASSPANESSGVKLQAWTMGKVFSAIAKKESIDENSDSLISKKELQNYINTLDEKKRGNLLFAKTMDYPVFGEMVYAYKKKTPQNTESSHSQQVTCFVINHAMLTESWCRRKSCWSVEPTCYDGQLPSFWWQWRLSSKTSSC